jgi:glycogen operon protein
MSGIEHLTNATRFTVRAPAASAVTLCLFDGATERREPMHRTNDDWTIDLPGDLTGARYGYRADGEWAPDRQLFFDPAKLLADPYATEFDRRFAWDPRLAVHGEDTASLVPKAIIPARPQEVPHEPPRFQRGGLLYELQVKAFTQLHPDVPKAQRGTVAALAHPAVIAHLKKIGVSAVELMPVTAWLDERHLAPLGLTNAWGYNPVTPMALDPGLCPGGVAELRDTVAALHAAGIGVILDLVLNHTGESDIHGGIVSFRGLDNAVYSHAPDGRLINDTGTGNTLDFGNPHVRRLAVDTLRHFVRHCGIDGFRFDLATIMARSPGFAPDAPIFAEIASDPWLADRITIAEPWDIGPGGYQLGHFPGNWLEWNDRYRDDVRQFWKGDVGLGTLATRIAGSADVYGEQACRSVNYLASHDGFTLADTLAFEERHNWDNGEQNHDGHGDNHSWNNGIEGPADDPEVLARRARDARAMLATLFASTGTVMLTAGDEFGRSQRGNNNAYAQDNAIAWVDWEHRDIGLEDFVARLAALRGGNPHWFAQFPREGHWIAPDGMPMLPADWDDAGGDGFAFTSGDPDAPYRFSIARASRDVIIGKVSTPQD